MFLIFKKRKGFTLIELLIVIAMISIITGAVMVNFRISGRIFDMERDVSLLAQDIRKSLEMTMAMRDIIPQGCPPLTDPSVPPNSIIAFGIDFQTGRDDYYYNKMGYIIDTNGDIFCRGKVGPQIPFGQTKYVSRVFEQGYISNIELSPTNVSVATTSIIFVPPHPRTFIGGISTNPPDPKWQSLHDSVQITIEMRDKFGETKKIKVNRAGLIEIMR